MNAEFWVISFVPMLTGVLAAIACAIPGNFLILRRQALIGDAISHVVLPGIVVSFLVTGQVAGYAMMIGAAIAAIVAVFAIETVRRVGQVEPGAAMGVVFTAMFAAGVLVLERSDTSSVHLDVEHALMGNLESLIWLDATSAASLLDPAALAGLPTELPRMAIATVLIAVLMLVFWRPLAIATFDEMYARAIGLPVDLISLGLVVAATAAAVAAFDAVGSIIVIAMFVCPPAAARLVTNRLADQVALSVLFAAISAVLGYVLAGYAPLWLGFENAISAAGMIATVSGLMLALTALRSPARSD